LDKGDYVKLQVRHEKKDLLEKISEAVMLASFKQTNSLNLDIYKSFNNAIVANNKKITSFPMSGSSTKPIYAAPLSAEKITKNAVAQSSWFEGQITFAKDEIGRKVDTHNFHYIITEGPVVKKLNVSTIKDSKSKMEEYKEGLRDYQCQMIAKLEGDDAENLYTEVRNVNPGFVGAHLALIQSIEAPDGGEIKHQLPYAFLKQLRDGASDVEELKLKLSKIAKLSELVIDGISPEVLLAYYGIKSDNRPDAAKIKQQMDKQKQQLLEAYMKKGVSVSKLMMIQKHQQETGDAPNDELDNLMVDMAKFVDFNDTKLSRPCSNVFYCLSLFQTFQYLTLPIWQSYSRNHQGRLLKYLQKLYEDKLQRDVLEEMKEVVDSNNTWPHISTLLTRAIVTANPQGYRIF